MIYISEMSDDAIRKMHMIPAHSISEALELAKELLAQENLRIVAIPDGVSVVVES